MKIFVIGSDTEERNIKRLVQALSNHDNVAVRYIDRNVNTTQKALIKHCFDSIEWSEYILVVLKDDLLIEDHLLYTIEYAQRMDKIVALIPKLPEVIR